MWSDQTLNTLASQQMNAYKECRFEEDNTLLALQKKHLEQLEGFKDAICLLKQTLFFTEVNSHLGDAIRKALHNLRELK